MRITGGEWRSRQLKGPGRSSRIRPTPDALRERAFAVLGDRVTGTRLLDLYAGTGAVGFEALSRGASEVVFVESDRGAIRLIEANLNALGAHDRVRLIGRPAARAVALLASDRQLFHIAWADPPFEAWRKGLDVLLSALERGVVEPGGLACLECPEQADVEAVLPEWVEVGRDLAGGASRVVMLRRARGVR